MCECITKIVCASVSVFVCVCRETEEGAHVCLFKFVWVLMLLQNPLVFDCRKRILRLGIDYDLCLQFTFPEQKYAQNYAVPIGSEPSKRN